MSRVLVVYSTEEGQTEKIASAIADELILQDHRVDLVDANSLFQNFDPKKYQSVIIGASVHMSRFSSELEEWVKENSDLLSQVPSAFFSVCLGILEKKNENAQKAEKKS